MAIRVIGVVRVVDRPFEPRHIRQVLEMPAGAERREECSERFTVLEQTRDDGWMRADVLVGGVAEEALVHEAAYDGEGCDRARPSA